MRSMLTAALGSSGAGEIAANQLIQTHIVADRCKGFAGSESANLQKLSLAGSAIANVFSRRLLSWFFQRTIFTNMRASGPDQSPFCSLNDLDTTIVPLTEENVSEAMLASGSIPFLLKGKECRGAPEGLYWDGGITDYHFDLPFHLIEGLVLYPHFSPTIKPGWFDKKLFWRHRLEHFDNVVVVTPVLSSRLVCRVVKFPTVMTFNDTVKAKGCKLEPGAGFHTNWRWISPTG